MSLFAVEALPEVAFLLVPHEDSSNMAAKTAARLIENLFLIYVFL